jgi:hypothetical protein
MTFGGRALFRSLAASALVLVSLAFTPGEGSVFDTFPVPPASKDLLFYIQRNKNANTIVYEAMRDGTGALAEEDPVRAQWIRYTEGGKREDLGLFESSVAYGIKHRNTVDGAARMVFNASNKYPFSVVVRPDGQAEARMMINGKAARLRVIRVQADESSWLPKVAWVDIIGTDLVTGQSLTQRVVP